MTGAGEDPVNQFLGVGDDAHGADGEQTQVAAHQQGLGVGIGDTAQTGLAVHGVHIFLKLGAEGGIFNVVNLTLEALFRVINSHTTPLGTQVGVVVGSEEHIVFTVIAGHSSEEATHRNLLLRE